MTTITAKILADSRSNGARLTTMELRYPRLIHAEFMTHRMFSRNASSSRAIPVERLIQDVLDDTAMPVHWGKNQPGMQAREEHNALITFPHLDGYWVGDATPEEAWLEARDRAVDMARRFNRAGYHKQVVNRLLEPFAHINVVVTATDWTNWFLLRDHPDADPTIQVLARAMKAAMNESSPRLVKPGEWHLPYILDWERDTYSWSALSMASAARCARVSYKTHEGKEADVSDDQYLFHKLAVAQPPHLSPLEHVCRPNPVRGRVANLRDWIQLRKDYEPPVPPSPALSMVAAA